MSRGSSLSVTVLIIVRHHSRADRGEGSNITGSGIKIAKSHSFPPRTIYAIHASHCSRLLTMSRCNYEWTERTRRTRTATRARTSCEEGRKKRKKKYLDTIIGRVLLQYRIVLPFPPASRNFPFAFSYTSPCTIRRYQSARYRERPKHQNAATRSRADFFFRVCITSRRLTRTLRDASVSRAYYVKRIAVRVQINYFKSELFLLYFFTFALLKS